MLIEILVLAKSFKTGGYCVGGVQVVVGDDGRRSLTDRWIRPVTMTAAGEQKGCMAVSVCNDFSVFDVIELNLAPAEITPGQPENYLMLDNTVRQIAHLSRLECLNNFIDSSEPLWSDSQASRDDQISPNTLSAYPKQSSLRLIQPGNLVFTLELDCQNGEYRKHIFESFSFAGKAYHRIKVTEPAITKIFKNQFPASLGVSLQKRLLNEDRYWLTLSLTPEFMGYHYVLVASVIDQSGYINRTYG